MPGIQNSKDTLDFLGTIGSKDNDKVRLNNVAKALVNLAGFLIGRAEDNLQNKGSTATGGTANSMKAGPLEIKATKMKIDIEIASTYKFLDQGVKGVESGSGKYAFKTKYPSAKMAKAIRGWLRVRKVATKYKAISATERKNKRVKKMVQNADGLLTGLSYGIATNIKKKGIKRTLFFTNAVKDTRKEQKLKYANALKLDIIESFPTSFN